MALSSSPIKILGKSVEGFLSYDRTNKQTNRDFNFIYRYKELFSKISHFALPCLQSLLLFTMKPQIISCLYTSKLKVKKTLPPPAPPFLSSVNISGFKHILILLTLINYLIRIFYFASQIISVMISSQQFSKN